MVRRNVEVVAVVSMSVDAEGENTRELIRFAREIASEHGPKSGSGDGWDLQVSDWVPNGV